MLTLFQKTNRIRRLGQRAGNAARRGVTAIEFALIAPVLMLFLMGIMELSLILLAQHLLENATYNASRLAKTGFVEAETTQLATVTEELHKRLSGLDPLLDVSKVTMTSTSYGDLSAIGQPEEGTDENLGTAGQVVVYTVSYPWKMFTPVIGNLMGDQNRIMTLTSRIVVRNEPYDN